MADSPVTLDAFRALARTGGDMSSVDLCLRKGYAADLVKAEGGGQYTATISTGAVDRDRDTIAVAGWQVDSFLKAGGPVLWAHQSHDLPVAKAPWVRAQGGVLKARFEYPAEGVYPFADTVRGLMDFGVLRAFSVGFRPMPEKASWNEERGGIDFKEQELLEFSIVPVPANPEALIDAKAAGIDLAPLKAWAERVLDGVEPGLWIPRNVAERALKLATGERETVTVTIPEGHYTPEQMGKAVDFAIEVGKRGRVLSQANEDRLRGARGSADALCAALDEVLVQLEAAPEEPKAAPPANVVTFRAPVVERFQITESELKAAVEGAVTEAVQAGVRRARGRLD